MDQSARDRVALNEATFRTVNEAIRGGGDADARTSYVCECGRLGCNRLVQLTLAEYEAVRRDSRDFFVVPGHEIEETEDVVERHDRYVAVRKHPDVVDIVDRTDPRRGPVDPWSALRAGNEPVQRAVAIPPAQRMRTRGPATRPYTGR